MFETFYLLFGSSDCNPSDLSGIYSFTGLCLIFIPLALAALFFLVLNGFASFYKFKEKMHWWIFSVICSVLMFGFAYMISSALGCDSIPYNITFGVVNAIFGFILYLVYSLFLKSFSLHAKYVPFDYLIIKK